MKARLLACMGALALAGAAAAQPPGPLHNGRGWDSTGFWQGAPDSPRDRIRFLQNRIDRGIGDGSLDRREAHRANRELGRIRAMDARMHYRDGRLSGREQAMLQGRLDDLSRSVRWARHNG